MSGLYVASNTKSLSSQIQLQRNISDLSDVLTRLSTGLRINSGKDDPAGLIASELLKSDISATKQAIQNTARANSVIAVADSALGQVSSLLNDIRVLVNSSANTGAMTADQIAANQLQVDASIDSIDRIAKTTNFQGQKLLDGSMGFSTANSSIGANGQLDNVKIQQANFGSGTSLDVSVKLLEASKRGTLIYNGTGVGTDTVITVGGSGGSEIFKFGAGTTNSEMADAINRYSDSTGVQAFVEGIAQRGSVTLSSAGSNNDLVITAKDAGLDAGNYTFRIVQGNNNDARIVSDPAGKTPGVVEISLVGTYEQKFSNFGGMFDITTNTDFGGANAATQATSVEIARGTTNSAQFFTTDANATGTSSSGITAVVDDVAVGTRASQYNGWTLAIDSAKGTADGVIDYNNKTIYFAETTLTAGADTKIDEAFTLANGGTDAANNAASIVFSGIAATGTLTNGTRLTFGGGGDEGELYVTYKEGATVGEIQDLINSTPNVQASLVGGVNRADLVKDIPSDITYLEGSGTNAMSKYTSGATSQQVIDLINSKLGDKFTATALSGDLTGGRVSYQDAAADYGDINLDNAIRFTGMDSGPIVRLVAGGPNQALSVKIVQPNESDIANGVHTPVLQINLATDGSGNSITTAKELADMFDRLTPAETLGVSAELLLPPGVDPNGRTWTTDSCGNETLSDSCSSTFGMGIVQPTGEPGPCEIMQSDLVLLGGNQSIVAANAVARISSATTVEAVDAESAAGTSTGTSTLKFIGTSAMNGLKFGFTFDETKEGFDEASGQLSIYLSPTTTTKGDLEIAINSSIAANWEAIRAYTGATGSAVTVDNAGLDIAKATADAGTGATTEISGTTATGTPYGTRGVGVTDAAMTITAKDKGSEMAGVNIQFVQDTSLIAYAGKGNAADVTVSYQANDNGTMTLVVRANATAIDSIDLASALNANTTFNKLFSAGAAMAGANAAIGNVGFSNDATYVAAETTGGYRIDSAPSRLDGNVGTSSGISMTGQSDSNERLVLEAMESGSANFVDVKVAQGSFRTFCPMGTEMGHLNGMDAAITVNGQNAMTNGDNFSVSSTGLQMSGTVNNLGVGQTSSFTITGGGATFQMGPDVVSNQQMRIGIDSVDSTTLGGASGKLYMLKSGEIADMKTNTKLADRIVQEAIVSIANTRGYLGAMQKSALEPNQAVLEDSVEQLSAAEALISNADFAEESSALTRAQILVQSGSQVLALANQFPQYAAQLVG